MNYLIFSEAVEKFVNNIALKIRRILSSKIVLNLIQSSVHPHINIERDPTIVGFQEDTMVQKVIERVGKGHSFFRHEHFQLVFIDFRRRVLVYFQKLYKKIVDTGEKIVELGETDFAIAVLVELLNQNFHRLLVEISTGESFF